MANIAEELHGIWRLIPSISLSEIIGQCKFDFQVLDCEHGAYDFYTLEQDIKICHLNECLAYVRVSGLNKVEIQRCLDLGADGIVFPQLNNYADFEMATKLVQYPPRGLRGFNPFVSAGGYGFTNIHDKKILCIAIIETLKAVEDIERILTLQDLDMLYIGSYDLSAQLDCIGVMDSPKLIKVIDEIIQKSIKASKQISIMVNDTISYNKYRTKGVNCFVHTVDSYQIKKTFINLIENLK